MTRFDFPFVFVFCDTFVGFHVFPTFVLYELTILLVLTLTLVIMKVQIFFSGSHFTHSPSWLGKLDSPISLSS